MQKPWVVTEETGTDNEREVADFPSLKAAIRWADENYGSDYREQGIDVMRRLLDGTLTTEY